MKAKSIWAGSNGEIKSTFQESMADDIVKAYGGELKVETKEGEGSTFIIQILMI